jgi:hypothetical protein
MARRSSLANASSVCAGLALALAACNSDSMTDGAGNAPGNTTPLTQAEAQVVADEMRGEVSGMANGVSLAGMLAPQFEMPMEAIRVFPGPRTFTHPVDCPTLSEFPPTDLDHDLIPDNLTITFDSLKCTFGHTEGHAVFKINGTIHIVDPSQTDKAIRVEFGALQHKFTVEDTIFWLRRLDGPWQLLTSSAGFSATDSTTARRESSSRPVSELAKRWNVSFVAATGETFSPHSRLPSGDFTIRGSTKRTRGTDVKTFAVTTVAPLHFDAACDADDRIVSGELDVEYTRAGGTTTVNIKWNGCGVDPIVTVTPPAI